MAHHRPLSYFFAFLVLTVASGCGDSSQDQAINLPIEQNGPATQAESVQIASTTFGQFLTSDQQAYLADLRQRGKVTVALRAGVDSYAVQPDGTIQGFDYHYALAFAEALDLPLEVTIVQEISEFYAQESGFDPSVMSDESILYKPSLFNKVDILAAPLAVNAWRERLSYMVPMFPVGLGIIGLNVANIESYADLDGLSVAIAPGSFLGPFLRNIEQQYGIELEYREYAQSTAGIVYDLLIENFADFSVDGSLFMARRLDTLEELQISPLKLSLVPVGWAVDSSDEAMQSILSSFVAYSFAHGIMHRLWIEQQGVDLDFYLSITGS